MKKVFSLIIALSASFPIFSSDQNPPKVTASPVDTAHPGGGGGPQ